MYPSVEPLSVQKLDVLLRQSLGNDLQIKHIEWKPLTAPGENFGSVMLAIIVTLTRSSNKTETLHLVAKLPPTSAYLLGLFNSPVTFRKELQFYSVMVKEFTNLQIESDVNEKDARDLVPKFFGGRLGLKNPEQFDEQAAIILENLKLSGYDTGDRIFGLDKKHTEFAIESLAKLHALAIALKMKKPQLYERIAAEVFLDVSNEITEKCVKDMFGKSKSDLESMEEIRPYLDRINKTIEYGLEANKNLKKPEEPWATFVHSDFWVNNMMFRHDEKGELVDMKIVDFQLSAYDYGVKDLIFFLVSSANEEILDNKLDHMFDLYYSCFIKMLKTLKVDTEKFSKQKFDEILNRCGPVKFNQCIMMAQVIQAPKKSTSESENVEGSNVFIDISDNVIYKRKLLHIVTLFDKRGWLIC
ncbi:uncharacterized protein LOC117215863 [Bombus bifarius]|uniref:Uncharacterized protein LOC117215863 n=1 Tax=Bombus bifarius TaxID=103933 RepID=A0A6P8NW50_9HYME|nr:uncharacterized protein LOC117215863 [Bombus bifarius]